MSDKIKDNTVDDHVDDVIFECLNPQQPKSFFLFAGAGSGKTRSLVNVLDRFKKKYGGDFKLYRQRIAIITYTNAAANEINKRLQYETIFQVSTIHSFSWELIKHFTKDIKEWLKLNLQTDIAELNEAQSKSRDLNNKTSIDRARKIESKEKRLQNLDTIKKFTYSPNGDNISKASLNHSEVISITASFIKDKALMQDIVIAKFPIIFVDESQDTRKEMIDALFALQANKKSQFMIGLFGDMMQRIYSDGKENLDKGLPDDWATPSKKMNHRSNSRIIRLINDIRKVVDDQEQTPRVEKEAGLIRLFICASNANKQNTERTIAERMAALTKDALWDVASGDIMTLILEHHMAASRMGFLDLFQPLYKSPLQEGLLNGSVASLNLFTKTILPLVTAHTAGDKFSVARIIKDQSPLLKKDALINSKEQLENLKNANNAFSELIDLWNNGHDPKLLNVLENINNSKLFEIPSPLNIIVSRKQGEITVVKTQQEDEEEDTDSVIDAWDQALQSPFSQIEKYSTYFSEKSKFGTHQGVKGLEYPRVMVILDDEEARGFRFSYDKLFGVKDLTTNDLKNIKEGKETGIDSTRRLFYVACSRAEKSLAVVAYTSDLNKLKSTAIKNGWFEDSEIEIINGN